MGRIHSCNKILDYFSNISNDWTRNIKIKIMFGKEIFDNKKILIYGLGLSGKILLQVFIKKSRITVFDDNNSLKK